MKLASIEKIHSIKDHSNADRLSVAKVKAWPVVIGRDQFKENDLVVFIVIDSVVPERPEFEMMRKQKFRVWNARFRGEPSSGLVMPLTILPEGIEIVEGNDVTEVLGVTKYEKPITDLRLAGDAAGRFPTDLISISDEDNALNFPEAFDELPNGTPLYLTLKNDGSSTTFIVKDGEFSACSRKLMMKEGSGFPWAASTKYNLKEKMLGLGRNIAIQCECIGPKFNGNRLGLKDLELRMFRAKNLDTTEIFDYNQLKELAQTLGIPIVEEISVIEFDKNVHTIEWFRELADSLKWPTNGEPAEGLVVAPVTPMYSHSLRKSWSVKFINQNYKQ